MFNLAAAFAGFGAFFSAMFGGFHASTTPPMMHQPMQNSAWEASSTTPHPGMGMGMMGGGMGMRNGIFGTVTTVSGTMLTIDGRQGTSTASTTFSVDATNAKIIKGPATSTASISDISVGDRVVVQGTVTGSSVAATTIIDGKFPGGMGMRGQGMQQEMQGGMPGMASSTMHGMYGMMGRMASTTGRMMPPPGGQGHGGWVASSTNGMPPMRPGAPGMMHGNPPAQGGSQVEGQMNVNAGPAGNAAPQPW
jgi:hypothetical protein